MSPASSRHTWIDLLRGIAVIGMIWTHAANTFLATALQATPTFQTMTYFHGLVAPAFFWLAGFMRGRSSTKPGPRRPAWPTVKRLLLIWCIGMLLHLPWNAVATLHFDEAAWHEVLKFDVLHCLALSCLILLGIEQLCTGRKLRAWPLVLALGLGVVFLSDRANAMPALFLPLDVILSKETGSLFPMFPWFGFAAAGFVAGALGTPSWRWALPAACVALLMPRFPGTSGTVWFFFERLGWVVLFACIALSITGKLRRHGLILLAGRESLVMYAAHLVLMYSTPLWHGKTLHMALGATQSPAVVFVIFVGLLCLSLLLAYLNERRKQTRLIA
jgi:uncharacterized membrane protein